MWQHMYTPHGDVCVCMCVRTCVRVCPRLISGLKHLLRIFVNPLDICHVYVIYLSNLFNICHVGLFLFVLIYR